MKTKTLDDSTQATHPGGIPLSHRKLRVLRPDLYGLKAWWRRFKNRKNPQYTCQLTYIAEQLEHGLICSAVVVSTNPLFIAAYNTEIDCVAMLAFDDRFTAEYRLRPGTRLLCVSCFGRSPEYDADLIPGPKARGVWTGVHPVIADFLSDDRPQIEARKRALDEDYWLRCEKMGRDYAARRPGVARDGRPVLAAYAAEF